MKVFLGVVCLCFTSFAQFSATNAAESSEIKALLMTYKDDKLSADTRAVAKKLLIDLGYVFAPERRKRQTRDGSHWCCKIEDTRPDLVYPRTKLRAETEVRQETTRKCEIDNKLQDVVCTLETKNVTTLIYHTYQDFSQALIVEQGEEPCPAKHLTCCNKFFYFRALDHCASFADFKELLFIFSQFPDIPIWLINVNSLVNSANNGPN